MSEKKSNGVLRDTLFFSSIPCDVVVVFDEHLMKRVFAKFTSLFYTETTIHIVLLLLFKKKMTRFWKLPNCQNYGAFYQLCESMEKGYRRTIILEETVESLIDGWFFPFPNIFRKCYNSKVWVENPLQIPYMMSREANMMESECEDLAKYVHHISWWASYGQ